MREVTWSDPSVRHVLLQIRAQAPFVYGLTNYVAATLSANVLLAVGGSPAIGAAPGWPSAFSSGAKAVWINTAALMSSDAQTLLTAAAAAHEAGTPWVLDPVAIGAGAPEYDVITRDLLEFKPTVIRGNASELIALSGGDASAKGVDTTAKAEDAVSFAKKLSLQTGAIVALSGETDYIVQEQSLITVPGGDRRLTQVTGAGCSLAALIAACLAVSNDRLMATCSAHAFYAIAAERAAINAIGTGSFGIALIDQLSLLGTDERH